MSVKTLTWAVQLMSRKTEEVISAAAQALSRIRAMQIPVIEQSISEVVASERSLCDLHCGG